jgi:nucleoside-diphosphate-sugar epimerase
MRLLVTGATGFLGAHLLQRLAGEDDEVAVLVRPGADAWRIEPLRSRLKEIVGDLSKPDSYKDSVKEFAPEAVAHLAWSGVGNRHRNDVSQIEENLYGTLELLKVAREAGCGVWLGLGSQAEYGPLNARIKEDAPTRPTTLYGATKLSACVLCEQLCRQLDVRFVWLRLFSSYGPMDDPGWMIPQLILKLLGRARPALTEGTQRWDYIYAADVAEAIYLTLKTPEASGVFNLGSGEAHALRRIVEHIRDLIDPSLALGFGEVPFREDQVMHLEADTSRLHARSPAERVPLAEGLAKTVEWYRDHRDKFGGRVG